MLKVLAASACLLGCANAAYTATYTEIGLQAGADGGDLTDFDGDGDLDMIVAAEEGCSVVWFEQLSAASWAKHTVATGQIGPEDTVAGDFNNDGLNDLAWVNDEAETAGCLSGGKVVIAYQTSTSWTLQTLVVGLGAINLAAEDVNRDGHLDIVYADKTGDELVLLVNPGSSAPWTTQVLLSGVKADGAYEVLFVDMDCDGDKDIISTARANDKVFWLRRPATYTGTWDYIEIGSMDDPNHAILADVNGDGLTDVVAAAWAGGELAWFERSNGQWTRHTISLTASLVGVAAYDFDADGQLEVVAMQYLGSETASIFIFEPDNGVNQIWTKQTLSTGYAQTDEVWVTTIGGNTVVVATSNHLSQAGTGRAFYLVVAP